MPYQFGWLFIFLFVVASPLTAAASMQSPHEAKLIEGAKKEGFLMWYTAMSVDIAKPLVDSFEKKYPFIEVQFVRLGTAQMINRVITETLAGRWEFDLATVLGIETLARRKLFAPYLSPERDAYFAHFKDPEGRWTGIYHNNIVLGYNTTLVSDIEAPKDYDDLLDPRWKGKLAMENRDYTWYGTLMHAWGKEKGSRYMKQLANQYPQFRTDHASIAQHIAAGEFPLGWVYSFRIETMKKRGAPVDWIDSFNPIVAEVGGIALSAKARNPHAAKLFIDFALSKQGQKIVRASNRNPSRKDAETGAGKKDQSGLKVIAVPGQIEHNLKQLAAEYRQTFGIK